MTRPIRAVVTLREWLGEIVATVSDGETVEVIRQQSSTEQGEGMSDDTLTCPICDSVAEGGHKVGGRGWPQGR